MWIEYLILIVTYIVVTYLFFFKYFLKEWGKQTAKIVTIQELTQLKLEVKKNFDESLESYKQQLNKELGLEIESLKAEFSKNNITHQIQFGYLHQERAKAILEIYRKLNELSFALFRFVAGLRLPEADKDNERKIRYDNLNNALKDFRNYYIENKLYFPVGICKDLDEFYNRCYEYGWDYDHNYQILAKYSPSPPAQKHLEDNMEKLTYEVQEVLPAKIKDIENYFRKLLSVEDL